MIDNDLSYVELRRSGRSQFVHIRSRLLAEVLCSPNLVSAAAERPESWEVCPVCRTVAGSKRFAARRARALLRVAS